MPKVKIRSMIRALPGHELLAFDLSQAESWVVAYLANEPNMKKALQFGDIHAQTAVALFHQDKVGCDHKWKSGDKDSKVCIADNGCGVIVLYDERYLGKKSNHASAYGMQPPRQAEVINAESDKPPYITVTVAQTTAMNKAWHDFYNIKSWWQGIQDELNATRTLVTPYGRRRTFFAAWGNELFKEAYAFIPQSTVADHFNGAVHPQLGIVGGFRELYRRHVTKKYYEIVNHAHDSVLLHVPKPVSEDLIYEIRSIIERPMIVNNEEFTIPVDGERGERFGELEKIKWKKAA
jgi:DNA polymerase I-like protein with 3'-5' exonuclease and polymerase domains